MGESAKTQCIATNERRALSVTTIDDFLTAGFDQHCDYRCILSGEVRQFEPVLQIGDCACDVAFGGCIYLA